MKLHFEDCYQDERLVYQKHAIEAVCDLFRGQENSRSEFTVVRHVVRDQTLMPFSETERGIGNRLILHSDELLENLRDVQLRNGLRQSTSLDSRDFTIEMETGTGKTYVYLRTIYELNRRYGFSKFAIVVPSIAIKEGVTSSLIQMKSHFDALYSNTPMVSFAYDSSKPGDVRNFATNSQIQIMVMTVGAINKKDVNNLYKPHEKTGDEKPIDLIKATQPIVIVDEPQSVDGGLEGRGKEALAAMNPLCTLRYSATHANKHHMIYRLDAVDAYEKKLVKQIEVASAEISGGHNKAYVRVVSISDKKNQITAKVELDVQTKQSIGRKEVIVQDGDDLEQTTGRKLYAGYTIGEIFRKKGQESVELRYPGGEKWLSVGEAIGDVDQNAVKRLMIRRTIKEHLDKEKRLNPAPTSVKVLSLFFIDTVEHYRQYDEQGNQVKGKYAKMFEEEYRRWMKHPDYQLLFKDVDTKSDPSEVHNGYFSIDKKGNWTETDENNQGSRDNAERAYNLIMKEKEKLLGFDTKLRFIFSHSALKEGWDNPNVFQICALREIGTERERRQTIGRGLRLCVNQDGQRLRGHDVNTLTVIATENYEQFAENLQREIEAETGLRFGIVEKHQFANLTQVSSQGTPQPMGIDNSEAIWDILRSQGLIDQRGNIQDALRKQLLEQTFTLPEPYTQQVGQVQEVLRKLAGKLNIKNADDRRTIRTRQAVLKDPEFQALWERIKHKTTYRVHFDNEKLIKDCIRAIDQAPVITKTRLQWHLAGLNYTRGEIGTEAIRSSRPEFIQEQDIELPDLLTELQDRTQLTRRSLVKILTECERLDDFLKNPQEFIKLVTDAIQQTKELAIVDGIKYQKIGKDAYYAQELFELEELTGYLKNTVAATKSVHEEVVYDSLTERAFAEQLEQNEAVKVYAKLPDWFKIPTPLGDYNPDWAIVVEVSGVDRLYFVVETKATLIEGHLRGVEGAKINCGKKHFKAIAEGDRPARFKQAVTLNDVLSEIESAEG